MKLELLTEDCIEWVQERYLKKYSSFDMALAGYKKLKEFAPDGNIWESSQNITEQEHYIMRLVTQYYITKAFNAMLIDLSDENVKEEFNTGNIGTPGRIAKMWCGSSINDSSELLSGRWIKEPRMASFQREDNINQQPIWIETQIRAVCSHHFIGFHNNPQDEESKVVVGYIPEKGIKGGLSKISRFVRDYASRRAWLQEDLCDYVGRKIQEQFKSSSVFVGMYKINHGCTWTRGANDQDAGTTTIFKSGKFLEDENLIPQKYRG